MKKKIFSILLAIMLLFQTGASISYATSEANDQIEIYNLVVVGYDETDKYDIFGDMDEQEIERFMEEYSIYILTNMNTEKNSLNVVKEESLLKYGVNLEKLFIEINDTTLNTVNESYELEDYINLSTYILNNITSQTWRKHATHILNYSITADTSVGFITEYFTSEVDTDRKLITPPGLMEQYIYRIVDVRTTPRLGLAGRWRIVGRNIDGIRATVNFRFNDLGTFATKSITFVVGPDGRIITR